MTTFFIYPNTCKSGVEETLPEVCNFLIARGAAILLPQDYTKVHLNSSHITYLPTQQAVQHADIIIVMGGDGTMLRIARCAAKYNVPMLGINLGHLGFMTEIERDEIECMDKLFTGDYSLDERMMLHVAIRRDGEIVCESDALNDIVVTKGNTFRVVQVEIEADHVPVTIFKGDGVIASTPTGTTAYALSAGGPIIEPDTEDIAVTPICAHALQAKSFVFGSNRLVTIHASCEYGDNVFVSTDGDDGISVRPDDLIEITKSQYVTRLVRLKGRSFYQILQQKL